MATRRSRASIQNAEVTASEPCPIRPTVPHFNVWSPNARSSGQLPSSRCELVNRSTWRFAVDAIEASNSVERRHGLSGLQKVAEISLVVTQIQDTIRQYRAQSVEGGLCAHHGTGGCIVDRDLVGIPFGRALELGIGDQGFQPSLGSPGFRAVAEIGNDIRIDDGVRFETKARHHIGFVVRPEPRS